MILRPEQPADHRAIAAVVEAAFPSPAEARLVEQLRAAGDAAIALVAVEGEAVIGHVMLSLMTAPFRALGLAPVSVRPDRQGQGVGGRLVRRALDLARDKAWDRVFVLGDPAYYRRFGFDAALAAGYGSPYAGPHLMGLDLSGRGVTGEGEIAYAPAFAALD